VLVAGVPALSYVTARNNELRSVPRTVLYRSAMLSQWLLTIPAFGIEFLNARRISAQGFAPITWGQLAGWGTGIAIVAIAALAVVIECERHGWLPRESELVYLLIPETPREKLWAAVLVAPTAAFCEELLYRGYLLSQLDGWLHSLAWAVVVCSTAFGLAHWYQGWCGMARAGLLGALLACPVIYTRSLWPAMLAHWTIDAVALLCLGPSMVEHQSPPAAGLMK
jgi:membrane protease YdiL (CAAX protease family)